LFVPLPRHIDVEQRFSRLLRGGYAGRNPTQAGHWPEMVKRAGSVSSTVKASAPPPTITDAGGMTMIGFSGLGKTTTVNRITNLYS
jgi:flagellar biosynthesis GTPase FlhF